jgi:hypothetical protein
VSYVKIDNVEAIGDNKVLFYPFIHSAKVIPVIWNAWEVVFIGDTLSIPRSLNVNMKAEINYLFY